MTQAVATEENITAIPSSKHTQQPNWQGAWVAGPIEVKTHDYFTLNGKPIAYEASCLFTFTGTDPANNGAAVTDQERITLTAKKTTLQPSILRNDDEETGEKDNKLQVKSTDHLTTD